MHEQLQQTTTKQENERNKNQKDEGKLERK